jgi:NTP pyrophosphatase (non-canonical NTP hydrolase)
MDFNEYQTLASRTATFDGKQKEYQMLYLTLGIAGESGEVAEKVKKILRNDNGVVDPEKRDALKHEIGDVLWYLSQLARILDIPFEECASANIAKLADRAARGVIKSEGDTR